MPRQSDVEKLRDLVRRDAVFTVDDDDPVRVTHDDLVVRRYGAQLDDAAEALRAVSGVTSVRREGGVLLVPRTAEVHVEAVAAGLRRYWDRVALGTPSRPWWRRLF
ncbi:MAG TPA: hypothetical protein VGP02_00110 [Mycobacteriales bacterium]|nr:hypothetical protein [Mycobacteriales bacterium]